MVINVKKDVSDLIEFSSDAAFVIDSDRKVTAWNELARKLLGYTSIDAIGQYCGDILQATLAGGEPMCHSNCAIFDCFHHCQATSVAHCLVQDRNGEWVTASVASIVLPQQKRPGHSDEDVAIIFLRNVMTSDNVLPHHTLQIFTLGGFGLVVAGQSIDFGRWKRKQAATLLKYLVTQIDRSVHRERLLDSLWPDVDEKQGWGRLKVTMYYLRRELRAHGLGDDVIKTIGSAYMLRRDAVWVDAEAFQRLFDHGRKLQDLSQWRDALTHYVEAEHLYRGDYLEEEAFEDWCAEERERLRELYLELLARTAECHAALNQYTEAIRVCRKALVVDPCRENFHFALMEYLVRDDQPELALVVYRHCEHILAAEFGIAPLAKTQRLFQQIVQDTNGSQDIDKKHG
jgi:PAS domain S-box-containing protein